MTDNVEAVGESGAPWLRSTARLSALSLLGIWLSCFGPQLFSDVVPFYRDQLLTVIPFKDYLRQRLIHGELPQWYPYEAMGVPFMGQVVTATFHPMTWLFLPLNASTASKLQTLSCYLVALIGAYKACRALAGSRLAAVTGAVAFALGGYTLGVSHNPCYLTAHVTLPFVMWAALRLLETGALRHAALLGVTWGLVLLAGDAQAYGMSGLLVLTAVAIRGVRWRTAALLGAAAVISILVPAIELLPALAISRESIRVLGKPDPLLDRIFSLHPLRIFELLIPNPIPDELRVEVTTALFHDGGSLWATSLFAGALTLSCAAFALHRRRLGAVLGGLFVLSLGLAMGSHAGLLPLAAKVLPVLNQFRFPEKYAGSAWVALALLTSVGIDQMRAHPRRAAVALGGLAGVLLILAGCAASLDVAGAVFTGLREGALPSASVVAETNAAWRAGLLQGALFAVGASAVVWISTSHPAIIVLLPLLVVAELAHANLRHLPMVERAVIDEPTSFASAVLADARGQLARSIPISGGHAKRTVTGDSADWAVVMRQLLRADECGRSKIASFFFNLPGTSVRAWRALGPMATKRSQFGALYGACYRVVDGASPIAPGELELAADSTLGLVLRKSSCRPRAYLASAAAVATSAQALEALVGLAADAVVWEGGPNLDSSGGRVALKTDDPEHVVLDVDAASASALVLNDQFAPGWTATVDGKGSEIFPTNEAVRGVLVPAGPHRVEFAYGTPSLTLGAAFSSLGLALAVLLACWSPLRRSCRRTPLCAIGGSPRHRRWGGPFWVP